MDAMTQCQPTNQNTGQPARPRLLTAALARVLAASFGALSSFYLLLSVTPMLTTSAGSAGAVTGVLMFGGVLAELATPRLMARLGVRRVLAIGLVLLGTPSLLLVVSDQLAVIVAVCAVRGVGFGLTVVASGSLVVSLVPAERRGEGLGVFGVVASAPGIVALPAGVWLADHAGYRLVFALAAVAALGGLAAQLGLPRPASAVTSAVAPSDEPSGLLDGLRSSSQMRLALAFVATTVAAGIVVAFLPLAGLSSSAGAAALLVQAVTATVGRWAAGRYGDRRGHRRLLVPGLVTTALGMALLAGAANPVSLMAGAALFGVGFGAVQCVTLALTIERVAPSGYGMVNAVWNLAYDMGYGAGPVAFGAIVGRTGYPVAFALTALLVLTALVPALRDRPRTRHARIAAVALAQ